MKTQTLAVCLALAVPAFAQVVRVEGPSIVFPAPPPMVVVEPGVQVVQDNDDEVFFVDNVYWHRRGGRWYRNPSHNGAWVVVEEPMVPRALVRYPPGQYRHWHGRPVARETVIVNPPGPGKIKIKKEKHHR